jgi:tetratricopeptide (TPR) repeat protein
MTALDPGFGCALMKELSWTNGGGWRRVLQVAVILALGLGAAGEAHADLWYVHYENAERALKDGQWRTAVAELRQAIERKGDSGARVRSYGMKVVDYFPYLKLGIAYHHLGEESAALEAFDTEERLGVVQGSPEARGELAKYRQLVAQAQQQTASAAHRRTEEIVRNSLAEARRLDGEGRLQEAMNALAPGLAADPAQREAVDLMTSLRSRVVAQEQRQREAEALRGNLEKAKTLLAKGEAEQAAGLLRPLLAVGPNEEASRLLERAQAAIVAAAVAQAGSSPQSAKTSPKSSEIAAAALGEARQLQSAGRVTEALNRLETVLALEPGNGAARQLREQILAARQSSEQSLLIQETLRTAGAHLAGGRFEDALSAANRVLALDRKNAEALGIVGQAYAQISRRVLGAQVPGRPGAANIPPAIRFADLRQDVEGERAEIAGSSEFQLHGVAIDSSPVRIALSAAGGRPVETTSTSQAVGEYFITEFSARHKLRAGTTVLTVVATDNSGLSSRSQYEVIYRRPWFLSPWLYTAGGGGLGLGAAGLLMHRRRKRRDRRERRFNPYIAGGPIFDEQLFYGREPLIQRILQTVHNNSLLLHGERRIGKTSLLHQVQKRLEALDDPAFDFHPVYIDLQGTPEDKFFATLADQIAEVVPVGAETREPAVARASYSHHDLVRELHGVIKQLKEGSSKQVKLVLLIDEVDELNDYDPRVSQSLRSLFMKRFAENLAAVVAGVRIRKEWDKETSPWYNFFEEIEVDAIPPAEARRLVLEPIRGTFRCAAGAAERIVALSHGKPFQIQRRCLTLVQRLHEEGRRTITLADVEALEGQDLQ